LSQSWDGGKRLPTLLLAQQFLAKLLPVSIGREFIPLQLDRR